MDGNSTTGKWYLFGVVKYASNQRQDRLLALDNIGFLALWSTVVANVLKVFVACNTENT